MHTAKLLAARMVPSTPPLVGSEQALDVGQKVLKEGSAEIGRIRRRETAPGSIELPTSKC